MLLSDMCKELPNCILEKSGAASFTGSSAFKPGMMYVMGLNPGGDPDSADCGSIREALNEPKTDYSAYTDERWGNSLSGEALHQKRVVRMMCEFGLRPKEVFAMNAIFVRSKGVESLANAWPLWDHFWKIHKQALAVVRPRVILALGNGNGTSAMSLLLSKATGRPSPRMLGSSFRDGKVVCAQFHLGDGDHLDALVVGAPHPSRYAVPSSIVELLNKHRAPAH